MDLEGKGRGICFGAEFFFALSSIFALVFVGFGSSLPLTFPFGLIIGYAGILPEPCCYNWLIVVANFPI